MLMVSTPRKNVVSKEEEASVSSAEENKAIVRHFFEAQGRGDLDAMEEMLALDFVDHSLLPGQEPGRESYLQGFAEDWAVFSNIRLTVEDQVAEGDKVVTKVTVRSIHDRGEFMGVAPTGKEVTFTNIFIHRISGGKIVEEWSEGTDVLEAREQLLEQAIRARERVEQDLRVARSIQQASLPKEMPALEGWEISPLYRPAREVGGDFYDFHYLSEGRLGLVVGDATGKGVPAALVMSTTCGMLRLAAQSFSSPGEILKRVNEALFPYIPPNMFVTCFYGVLDPRSGSFTYANAGRSPLPLAWWGGRGTESKRDALGAHARHVLRGEGDSARAQE
jgi:predicted ester cyclase